MLVTTAAVALGLPEDATAEQVLARARRLGREARAAVREQGEALAAAAVRFDSEEADGVYFESATLHVRAEQLLAEQGVVTPTESQYAQACSAVELGTEYTAVGFVAETNPTPRIGEQRLPPHRLPRETVVDVLEGDRLQEHLDGETAIHDEAVRRLGGSGGVIPPGTSAAEYADALERARAERGGGRS